MDAAFSGSESPLSERNIAQDSANAAAALMDAATTLAANPGLAVRFVRLLFPEDALPEVPRPEPEAVPVAGWRRRLIPLLVDGGCTTGDLCALLEIDATECDRLLRLCGLGHVPNRPARAEWPGGMATADIARALRLFCVAPLLPLSRIAREANITTGRISRSRGSTSSTNLDALTLRNRLGELGISRRAWTREMDRRLAVGRPNASVAPPLGLFEWLAQRDRIRRNARGEIVWTREMEAEVARRWFALQSHRGIARSMGIPHNPEDRGGGPVKSKVHWLQLPSRLGLTLFEDYDPARAARFAFAFKGCKEKTCPLTLRPFWTMRPRAEWFSLAGIRTKHYRDGCATVH